MSPEQASALLSVVHPALRTLTGASITGIYQVISEIEGRLWGTGTLVEAAGTNLIVSAEHVLRQPPGHGLAFRCFEGSAPIQMEGPVYAFPPVVDVAVHACELDRVSALAERPIHPLQSAFLAKSNDYRPDIYFIHGFPGVKSYSGQLVGGVSSESFPYSSGLANGSSYDWFDERIHVAISYPATVTSFNGQEERMPDPRGLSGSLLWRANVLSAPAEWCATNAKVVGVVHNWDQKGNCLVCTRIEPLRRAILQCLRERRAYQTWQAAGSPDGLAFEHWLEAESALTDDSF
jgi:hypothetical protein